MKSVENEDSCWTTCPECLGRGKKSRRISKKERFRYQLAVEEFEKTNKHGVAPVRPKGNLFPCEKCKGSGLIAALSHPIPDHEKFPHVAIIGGGIGGVALAVACLHRGIPFSLFERDKSFDVRSQGYGLTLQQASKAIQSFGLFSLKNGLVSKRHVVHTTDGNVIGEWGIRKWLQTDENPFSKRTNVHIARQSLRLELLEQLGKHNSIYWGHQLIDVKEVAERGLELSFQVDGQIKHAKADLVVGADGIRSSVRRFLMDEDAPLRYLDCMVILGICPLAALHDFKHPLLDSETVFQTANGDARIYIMPFDATSVMWQLSFPISEKEASELSAMGVKALKEEACRRTQWHEPIPQILAATHEKAISGYPVYDREMLKPEQLANAASATLIGDAAHPMSPFKGQGANQAILDALALARAIYQESSNWKEKGIRAAVLTAFEIEMIKRSASKVKDSAAAAQFLHTDIVLHKADAPRGRGMLTKEG
ncbi:MAG: NAD(P)/FAD-dependent oxidoreductase [Bacteroidota bacterium]